MKKTCLLHKLCMMQNTTESCVASLLLLSPRHLVGVTDTVKGIVLTAPLERQTD